MKVIAIANQKGGVGKTTTAVSLAAGLSAKKRRILLIDLDPQGNATSGLGIEAEGYETIYPALLGKTSLSSQIRPTGRKNLSIVPAHMDLAGVEIELTLSGSHMTSLRDALEPIREADEYDYVILDTPPSLGVLMTASLSACDEIITPLQCEYLSLDGLAKILFVMEQIRESGVNPDLKHEGIIMTMFANTNLARQVVEQVRENMGSIMYETIVPRSVRVGEAPSFGRSIFEHDSYGLATVAYQKIVKEFLKRHEGK